MCFIFSLGNTQPVIFNFNDHFPSLRRLLVTVCYNGIPLGVFHGIVDQIGQYLL